MKSLGDFISTNNPYAYSYRQMNEIELEEERKAKIEGRKMVQVHMEFIKNDKDDKRTYNLPKVGEIAAVFTGEDGLPPSDIDFKVYPKSPDQYKLSNLNILSKHLDPMVYPLIHWYGEPGWTTGMKHENEFSTTKRTGLTHLQYYSYMIAIRNRVFSMIHSSGKLFHQYLVDGYCKLEANRLNYCKTHQTELRAENYKGLHDYVKQNGQNPVGRISILPSTFRVIYFIY